MRKIVGVLSAGVLLVTVGCGSGSSSSPPTGGTANPTAMPGAMPGPDGGGTGDGTGSGSGPGTAPDGGAAPDGGGTCASGVVTGTKGLSDVMAMDDLFLYFVDNDPTNGDVVLHRVAKAGGAVTTVQRLGGVVTSITGLAVDGTRVYWSTNAFLGKSASGFVRAMNKDGSGGVQELYGRANDGIESMILDPGGALYFAVGDGVWDMAPLGGMPHRITTGNIGQLAVDGTSIYVASFTITRAPKLGGAETLLATNPRPVAAIALDATRVYLTDSSGGLYALDKATPGAPTTIYFKARTMPADPRALAFDSGHLYWDAGDGLARVGSDGTGYAVLDGDSPGPLGLDGTTLFYGDRAANQLKLRCK